MKIQLSLPLFRSFDKVLQWVMLLQIYGIPKKSSIVKEYLQSYNFPHEAVP